MQDHIVAFVDILGFGSQVLAIKDAASFQKMYDNVKLVQAAFDNPDVSMHPEIQEETNKHWGVKVLALSDSVVVAINPRCEVLPHMGPSDYLGDTFYGLALSQIECVFTHDIFLRGGLGVGPFIFENEILVSPAQVQAYYVESKHAEVPVIALCKKTRDWIIANSKGRTGVAGWQKKYFRLLQKKIDQDAVYFLDYLRIAVDDYGEDVFTPLRTHKRRIEPKLSGTAKDKYQWLAKYHNETIDTYYPTASAEKIPV